MRSSRPPASIERLPVFSNQASTARSGLFTLNPFTPKPCAVASGQRNSQRLAHNLAEDRASAIEFHSKVVACRPVLWPLGGHRLPGMSDARFRGGPHLSKSGNSVDDPLLISRLACSVSEIPLNLSATIPFGTQAHSPRRSRSQGWPRHAHDASSSVGALFKARSVEVEM
jgi:hypothetical protein